MLKELSQLKKISFILNLCVLGLALVAYLSTGWENNPVTKISFVLLTLCFWGSVILNIIDTAKTGGYRKKSVRVSNIVRDFFCIVVVILVTFYTATQFFIP